LSQWQNKTDKMVFKIEDIVLVKVLCQEKGYDIIDKLEMWTNAQRDGRPAEYRWRPLFNAAKFG